MELCDEEGTMGPMAIIGGAVLLAVLLWFMRRRVDSSLMKALEEATSRNDVTPLLEAAEQLSPTQRSVFFQQAVLHLWNNWHRPMAISLIEHFTRKHPDEKIVQYWLKQAMEIEPQLARESYDDRFLKNYYRPEIAKECCQTSS